MARFAAPMDTKLQNLTRLGVGCVVGLAGLTLATIGRQLANGPAWIGAPLLVIPLLVAVVWGLAPRAFAVEGGALRVDRLLAPLAIPLDRIRAARVIAHGSLQDAQRVFGVSGLFGHIGRYCSPSLGTFGLYARRWDGPFVVVDTDEDRLVLAPSHPEGLISELLASAPHLAHGASGGAVRRPVPRWRRAAIVAAIAIPPGMVPALFYPTWAASPVAISVRGGAVHIDRQHAKSIELPLAGFRRVELLGRDRLRGAEREAGSAYGEVEYGTYRSDELGRFELYAFRDSGYVLLEDGTGGRVVVTPDDPARFVEDARARLIER